MKFKLKEKKEEIKKKEKALRKNVEEKTSVIKEKIKGEDEEKNEK